MRIVSAQNLQEAVETVTGFLIEQVESRPSSVIGLATGRTMEPVYALWVKWSLERKIDHSKCTFFLLDEYIGLSKNHPSTFRSYIQKHFIHPLNLSEEQFNFPPVDRGSQFTEAAEKYERSLKESGGVDLQLLGLGVNGHIGFNEPGSMRNSRTRKVTLAPETLAANGKSFEGEMPKEALSMGIGTILDSRRLLLLATGKSKADAIKYLQNHHDDLQCPVTFLKSHPHFTLVLDPDAASKINLNI